MAWDGWLTLALTLAMVIAMVLNVSGPEIIMLGGVTVLISAGVLTPKEALSGFSNEAMLSVAVLFVVAAGVRETGAMDFFVRGVLGRPKSAARAQARMMVPVGILSAFINNTPIVAIMLPLVQDWGRRIGVSPSRLLMPLSFATILGGTISIIGTSTNLVVVGLATTRHPTLHLGIFELAWVGLPVFVVGVLYTVIASRWLLPERSGTLESLEQAREYTVAMLVEPGSVVVGQTVEEAGLRHLPGLFLVEIEREGDVMPAVAPDTKLRQGDVLLFAGVVESVVDLRKIRGLVPATDQVSKLTQPRPNRCLIEAVVASRSPLVGRNIRESRFRTLYDAVIIAVHRHGERIRAKVGDIEPRVGDTLLLEAHPSFLSHHRNDPNFALVSEVADSAPPRHDRAWIAIALVLALVVANAVGWMSLVTAALLASGAMILTRCLTADQAMRAVELRVLVAIAASFAAGAALDKTGVAAILAHGLVGIGAPFGPIGVLAAVYVATAFLTELVTNNAAAALMFPLAMAAAEQAHLRERPFYFVLMMAASASFSTPIGYQTNLMVYGPGGYRFSDFLRLGVPMQLVVGVVTLAIVSVVWL